MRKKWWIFLLAPPAMVLFGWLFGEIVMHLWNWLMPMLFGVRQVTFWQALGMLVLCRILVGGLGGGSNGAKARQKSGARWERLTPEEHERFREWMRSRRGDLGTPNTGAQPTAG